MDSPPQGPASLASSAREPGRSPGPGPGPGPRQCAGNTLLQFLFKYQQMSNPKASLPEARYSKTSGPVVSVLITSFNHEKYIDECLQSILKQQTDFPVEIIVVDDCSTDSTAQILTSYTEKYPDIIKIFLSKENQRSLGKPVYSLAYKAASGEFIAGCDGDDFWLDTEKLQKQVELLRAFPECVFSFHNAVRMDAERQLEKVLCLNKKQARDYSQQDLWHFSSWIPQQSMLYRKCAKELPPEFDIVPNRDNFLPVFLAAYGGAKFQSDIKPSIYRIHTASFWSSKSAAEKNIINLRTFLIMTSYLLRIGKIDAAKHLILDRLLTSIKSLLGL